MRVVVDVGALDWMGDASIEKLVDLYSPDRLFAFDPYPEFIEKEWTLGRTMIIQRREAAWTANGNVLLVLDGTSSRVSQMGDYEAPCFDLASFLESFVGDEVILKLDCEGAEYTLLDALWGRGIDLRLERILIEWHGDDESSVRARDSLLARLRCSVEDWH